MTMGARIKSIASSSPARRYLSKGDIILEVNDKPLNDILDFIYYSYPPKVKLKYLHCGGKRIAYLKKETGHSLGVALEDIVFDGIKTCKNKCIFCFVDQLPRNLRKTLYVKDDDYRLSFLRGNFITLTNLTENDWRKIIEFKLSPLYVSVHSTNLDIRERLFGTHESRRIFSKLKRLKENKIKFHSQVVVCPGINDGKALEETINDLSIFYPYLLSIGIVPVGKTKYCRNREVRIFTRQASLRLCKLIKKYQNIFLNKYKKRLVYAADEFILKAGFKIPTAAYYEEYPQLENGIGMTRNFLDEFEELSKRFSEKKMREKIVLISGILFGRILEKLVNKKHLPFKVLKVKSAFWGSSVNVAGLLTFYDIIDALKKVDKNSNILIPDTCVNNGKFLDDKTVEDFKKKYPKVEVIGSNCGNLFDYIKG